MTKVDLHVQIEEENYEYLREKSFKKRTPKGKIINDLIEKDKIEEENK